jgi:hypothetical protein
MTRRQLEKERRMFGARIAVGWTPGVSLSEGIVHGAEDYDLGMAGSVGVVIPLGGDPHNKATMGVDS